MGGSPYWYYVSYEEDKNKALEKLRNKEFEAGRYYPVLDDIDFPIAGESQSPGKKHNTIKEASEESAETGTRSILDIQTVSEEDDYCIARILSEEELEDYFGTITPSKEVIEEYFDDFMDDIERGKAFCITVFDNDLPSELFFVGYSFD